MIVKCRGMRLSKQFENIFGKEKEIESNQVNFVKISEIRLKDIKNMELKKITSLIEDLVDTLYYKVM